MTTSSPPIAPPGPAAPDIDLSSTDLGCVRCGYNLRGLSPDGACPECGAPIDQSLRGDLLEFSSPEYLASLHRGVVVVLAAIIAQILLGFAIFGVTVAGAGASVTALFSLAATAAAIALVVGWWWFSAPDPGMLGSDKGDRPRQIVRITLIASVVATLLQTGAGISATSTAVPAGPTGALVAVAGILAFLAGIIGYFAQVLYVRWLARRLPNPKVEKRAGKLLWLGPVLYTFGLLLIGLGPLIALVLYWNMLEWVRKDLKRIRENQAA
jgi:hypothetical protein